MGIGSFLKNLGKNTVYYPGCLTRYVLQGEFENYKKILEYLKVDFLLLPEINCCGSPVLNAGYEQEARKLARKNLEAFKKHNVKKIITNCPACFKVLSKEYKSMLPDWNIEVEHVITTILSYLKKRDIQLEPREKITYHDPCHLGRHLGIYDEPREILKRLGFKLVEMRHNKEKALCCGGGAGLRTNNPKLANKIAQARIGEAKNTGVKKLVTPCPLCFAHLAENSDIEVLEFSQVIAEALGLEARKTVLKECQLKEACS